MADIVKQAWDLQGEVEQRARRIGKGRYGRVLKMARKPTPKEYRRVIWVVGLGLIVLGIVGFAVYLFIAVVPPWIMGLLG